MNSLEPAVLDFDETMVSSTNVNTVLPLRQTVKFTLENYLKQLDGNLPNNLYDLVMQQLEKPLFEVIISYTKQNQSKAAELLGISRGTLRKKLKQYQLDD